MASNYESRKRALQRRRELTEALMAQGMQQPQAQMVGPHYIAPNLVQQLAPALSVLAGGYAGDRLDKEESSIDAERQKELAAALQKIQQQQESGDSSWMWNALGSSDPALQGLGQKGMEYQLKPETFQHKLTVDPETGKPVYGKFGSKGSQKPGELAAPQELRAHRGAIWDQTTGEVIKDGVGFAPQGTRVNVTNILPGEQRLADDETYRKYLAQGVGKDASAVVASLRENEAMDVYIDQMDELVKKGALTGGAAPAIATMNNFLNTFGVNLSDELVNTYQGQTLNKQILKSALSGPGAARLTDKDLKVIENATSLMNQGNYGQASRILREWNASDRKIKLKTLEAQENFFQESKPAVDLVPPPEPVQSTQPAQIQGDEDYDALPSGTQFIGPDGKLRRKP